jgi:hypothetical protein
MIACLLAVLPEFLCTATNSIDAVITDAFLECFLSTVFTG